MLTLRQCVIKGAIYIGGGVGLFNLFFDYEQMNHPGAEFLANVVVNFGTTVLGGAIWGALFYFLMARFGPTD